jgi:3,4-dihydroxy 2-butanone 4-phosphate synthase/GTP cyclohydrolase II
MHKLQAYQLQDADADTVDANLALGMPADARDYGTGAQILAERSRGGIGKLAIQADLRAPCGPGQGNSHRGA